MCELYAINAKHPVEANALLQRFFEDSVNHPHGWGLSWREGDVIHLHKEGVRAIDSLYLRQVLTKPIVVTRIVAHIRNATKGVLSYENSHPFVLAEASGRTWAIAHNGTLFDEHLTSGYARAAKGNTDSERAALFLVDQLGEAARRQGSELTFDQRFEELSSLVTALAPQNKLNLLLDDGEYTYVHTNTVEPTLYVRVVGDTVLLCTCPQDDSGMWQELSHNRLIAYKDGQMVRAGEPHSHSIDESVYFRAIAELRAEA